jgi:hypothetical protein
MASRIEQDVRDRAADLGGSSEHAYVGAIVEDGTGAGEHSVHGSREP